MKTISSSSEEWHGIPRTLTILICLPYRSNQLVKDCRMAHTKLAVDVNQYSVKPRRNTRIRQWLSLEHRKPSKWNHSSWDHWQCWLGTPSKLLNLSSTTSLLGEANTSNLWDQVRTIIASSESSRVIASPTSDTKRKLCCVRLAWYMIVTPQRRQIGTWNWPAWGSASPLSSSTRVAKSKALRCLRKETSTTIQSILKLGQSLNAVSKTLYCSSKSISARTNSRASSSTAHKKSFC